MYHVLSSFQPRKSLLFYVGQFFVPGFHLCQHFFLHPIVSLLYPPYIYSTFYIIQTIANARFFFNIRKIGSRSDPSWILYLQAYYNSYYRLFSHNQKLTKPNDVCAMTSGTIFRYNGIILYFFKAVNYVQFFISGQRLYLRNSIIVYLVVCCFIKRQRRQ